MVPKGLGVVEGVVGVGVVGVVVGAAEVDTAAGSNIAASPETLADCDTFTLADCDTFTLVDCDTFTFADTPSDTTPLPGFIVSFEAFTEAGSLNYQITHSAYTYNILQTIFLGRRIGMALFVHNARTFQISLLWIRCIRFRQFLHR